MTRLLILLWERWVLGVDVLFIIFAKVPFFMVGWTIGRMIGFMAASFWIGVKDSWEDVKCDSKQL